MTAVSTKDVRASGLSARGSRSTWRDLRAAVVRSPWRTRLFVLVAAVAVGAVGSLALGANPLVGALTAAAVVVLAFLAALSPEGARVAAVVLLYLPVAAPLGFLYTAVAWGISPYAGDVAGGTLFLMGLAVVAAVAALRLSRGAPWLTVVLVEAATFIPGLLVLYVYPPMGLWAALFPAVVVLAWRCGLWSFVASQISVRRPPVSGLRGVPFELPEGCSGERLNRCPDGFVVVGRAGVFGVAVAEASGPASETSKDGLVVPGADVVAVAVAAVRAARQAGRVAGVRRQDAVPVVLVTGSANARVDRLTGVFVGRDFPGASPDAVVRVLGEKAFLDCLAVERWSSGRAARVLALALRRNARQRFA